MTVVGLVVGAVGLVVTVVVLVVVAVTVQAGNSGAVELDTLGVGVAVRVGDAEGLEVDGVVVVVTVALAVAVTVAHTGGGGMVAAIGSILTFEVSRWWSEVRAIFWVRSCSYFLNFTPAPKIQSTTMPGGGVQEVGVRTPPLAEIIPACWVTRQKTCFFAFMSPVQMTGRLLLARSSLTMAIW